jgi:hypothetical protein
MAGLSMELLPERIGAEIPVVAAGLRLGCIQRVNDKLKRIGH